MTKTARVADATYRCAFNPLQCPECGCFNLMAYSSLNGVDAPNGRKCESCGLYFQWSYASVPVAYIVTA